LRILLASPYDLTHLGGVTSHIYDLADQFTLEGHEVTVAGPTDGGRIHRDGVVKLGGSFRFPSQGDAARINLNPLIALKVRELIRKRDFDVVHMHEPFLGFLGASLIRYSDGIKVGTFHTWNKRTHVPYLVFGPLVRRWNQGLDGRIAVSESARTTVNRYVPDTYRVIPNGIPFDMFANPVPPPEHLRDSRPTILFVGRLEARKGVQVLLRSFQELKARMRDLRLVIVGDGSLNHHLQKWARDHQLQDVLFEGYKPREELPAYYQRADVFCAPSTENESFGITLLEGMAAARPVVATEGNGSQTLGEDGETGVVVEAGNHRMLTDALERLLEDRDLAERLGAAAQERAREFNWSIVASEIIDFYKEVSRQPSLSLAFASQSSAGS
jgi:phosphatidylinositol alpha-mannosyltransferase